MKGLYNLAVTYNKGDLWAQFGGLVRHEALKLQARLPAGVELDDLMQAGAIAVMNAVDQFDPSMGVKLKVFWRSVFAGHSLMNCVRMTGRRAAYGENRVKLAPRLPVWSSEPGMLRQNRKSRRNWKCRCRITRPFYRKQTQA